MLNKVSIMGRLTADPELRKVGEGTSVVSFRIATERDFKNKSGGREADFFDCTAWRSTADFVKKYFNKGNMAVIDGRLQYDRFTDKDGNNRSRVLIVVENIYFGSSKSDGSGTNQGFASTSTAKPTEDQIPEGFDGFMSVPDDEDLPF